MPLETAPIRPSPVCLGLLRARTFFVPTWRGWVALFLAAAICAAFLVRGVYPFLAVQDPRPGGLLVLEGWVPDYVLTEALAEMQRHPYDGILVTGEPVGKGAPLSEYADYSQMTVATLAKMGADPRRLHIAVTAGVPRDRTYSMGLALRDWLREHGQAQANVNLMSLGVHARRSRLLFEKALGREIGVIAIADQDFDPRRWWRTSSGVRGIVGEVIAWLYACVVFRASEAGAGTTVGPMAAQPH